MPRAIPLPIRQAVLRAAHRGLSPEALAQRFHLPLRTVYHLLQLGRGHGGQAPPPAYHRPPTGPHAPPALVRQAQALRQEHPDWGAELIRLILAQHFPDTPLPSGRSLRRWLRQAGLSRARAGRRPARDATARATAVHAVWQVDAADQMPLATGQLVSWLRWADECSGAVLKTIVSPLGLEPGAAAGGAGPLPPGVRAVGPARAVAAGQRPALGQLERLADGVGLVAGGPGGVGLLFNPPRQPQCNGVVEKSQDTGQRWCEPHRCRAVGQLQARPDEMDRLQREEYPSLQGRSRLQVFPELGQTPRPYTEAWEQGAWDLRRAQEYLAGFVAVRQANQQGQGSIYARRVSVGARHRGRPVVVQYDPDEQVWLLSDAEGRLWREVAAPEICRERILAVDISAR
jgi:hypothetical protein